MSARDLFFVQSRVGGPAGCKEAKGGVPKLSGRAKRKPGRAQPE